MILDTQASLNNLVQQVEQILDQWKEHEEDEFPSQQIASPQDSKECCVIQTLQGATNYDYMQEDTRIEEPPGEDYSPMEELANLEIPPESAPSYVYTPHIQYPEAAKQPTKLHEGIETDMFEGVIHTNSKSDPTHDQHLTSLPDFYTRQIAKDKIIFAAVTDSEPTQPIKLKEIQDGSYHQDKFYVGMKKEFNGSPILLQEIQPVQKLWALNTRLHLELIRSNLNYFWIHTCIHSSQIQKEHKMRSRDTHSGDAEKPSMLMDPFHSFTLSLSHTSFQI
ncbi:hypothetical protein D8674_017975 [Pyrus ussuriensis x Pyrus communis]|uniref:Uncharacterized protein n=1 Tax=Pyrus ussuriensis x Pyrus communis TaxID=2448454 RepID=A0A5N5HEM4_9ROSA|nr:hypothetical protein D8674_017975 [Pyrus ussuriensis x Pyrus communis]